MSIMNLCTAWNIYVFRSYENDLFPCNNKSILMSILLFFCINVCMGKCCFSLFLASSKILYFHNSASNWSWSLLSSFCGDYGVLHHFRQYFSYIVAVISLGMIEDSTIWITVMNMCLFKDGNNLSTLIKTLS